MLANACAGTSSSPAVVFTRCASWRLGGGGGGGAGAGGQAMERIGGMGSLARPSAGALPVESVGGTDSERERRSQLVSAAEQRRRTVVLVQEHGGKVVGEQHSSRERCRRFVNSLQWQSTQLLAALLDLAMLFFEMNGGTLAVVNGVTALVLAVFCFDLVLRTYTYRQMLFRSVVAYFDFFIVCASCLMLFMPGMPGVSVLRLFRAFRVVRLFRRVKSLNKIVESLIRSVPGVVNSFVLLNLVMAIFAALTLLAAAILQGTVVVTCRAMRLAALPGLAATVLLAIGIAAYIAKLI